MITKLIKAALLAVLLAAIIQSLPDIKRYLEIRDMQLASATPTGDPPDAATSVCGVRTPARIQGPAGPWPPRRLLGR
jgi:hypothetical protein